MLMKGTRTISEDATYSSVLGKKRALIIHKSSSEMKERKLNYIVPAEDALNDTQGLQVVKLFW